MVIDPCSKVLANIDTFTLLEDFEENFKEYVLNHNKIKRTKVSIVFYRQGKVKMLPI